MGHTAKALGLGSRYVHKGRELRLCGWTQGVQGEYELYLEAYVLSKAQVLRGLVPRDSLATLDPVVVTIRDITSGVYSYGTTAFNESLRCEKHLMKAIHIMLVETGGNGDVTFDLVREIFATDTKGIVDALIAADRDPNATAPNSMEAGAS